jgi:hypothetical protein
MLALFLVLLQPNSSLRTPAKSARGLLRTSFDEKMPGQHPNALCLNGSEVGRETGREQVKQLWEGSLPYADVKEGQTVLGDWK